jgi:glycine betaine/choline ABC-type transport system substrate-binding protein
MSPDLPDFSRSRAILIGTSTYQDKEIRPLPAAANSLRGLREILTHPQLCGWPDERITVLHNPVDVRQLVTDLRQWAPDIDDVLLVYFVGHGTITPQGELCLALTDTDFTQSDVTGLEYRHVRDVLRNSPARIKIVILDCCYSGRAIEALCGGENLADVTEVRGAYVITSSDQAAHVPPVKEQADVCTSFTGELLDLIRTGIPGGPETLSLGLIYSQLRRRLRSGSFPAPNQRGTDTASDFAFTRNAALLPEPIERFPRPPPRRRRRRLTRRITAAAAVALLVATGATAATYGGFGTSGPHGPQPVKVVVGSANFPESTLIGEIYAEALEAKGIPVTTLSEPITREQSYPAIRHGEITVMPEYNGDLLTTVVNNKSTATTTKQIDTELTSKLPPSLEILNPAPAQDKDSITVTQKTADKYRLKSIADLRPIAGQLTIGAPPEFRYREQGSVGLTRKYRLTFGAFEALDESGPLTLDALKRGWVQAADMFTNDPAIKLDKLVTLPDPNNVFIPENVVPLVYRKGISATGIAALNAVSNKLTQGELLTLDGKYLVKREPVAKVAKGWLNDVGLT